MTLQKTPFLSDQSSSTHEDNNQKKLDTSVSVAPDESGRERLKRHRVAVAGQVWIPDKWGKEELLKDWIDGSAFEASLFPSGVVSARRALARDAMRSSPNNNNNKASAATAAAAAAAGALRILNSC